MIRSLIGLVALLISFAAICQEYKPMESHYNLYSGAIGDPIAPTKKDAKVSIEVLGKAAEDIFNQIGPDVKEVCNEEKGSRLRTKNGGAILCQYSKQDGYVCYIGVDLKKGKLVTASVC